MIDRRGIIVEEAAGEIIRRAAAPVSGFLSTTRRGLPNCVVPPRSSRQRSVFFGINAGGSGRRLRWPPPRNREPLCFEKSAGILIFRIESTFLSSIQRKLKIGTISSSVGRLLMELGFGGTNAFRICCNCPIVARASSSFRDHAVATGPGFSYLITSHNFSSISRSSTLQLHTE